MASVSDPSHHENRQRQSPRPPSARQLRYLRILAERTSTTFAMPATSTEASREITRLQRLPATPPSERGNDHELAADRDQPQLSTAIRAEEISGYGSSATWRTSRE